VSSLKVSGGSRDVTTHSAAGASTKSHAFVNLDVDTGNGQTLRVEVDAGDWSRALALGLPVPVKLGNLSTPRRTA
jgi:hypothetical protein